MTERIAVIGAGGHAKVVIAALGAMGYSRLVVFDDDPSRHGTSVLNYEVAGSTGDLDVGDFDAGILAVGSNRVRKKLAAALRLRWLTVVHPSACAHDSARLGAGTVVMAGAVIQPDAAIGDHVIINTGATVDHDCVIENFVHIAPGTHFAGAVRAKEGAFVGIGSSAIVGVTIGAWTTVGAGSVIIRDLPDEVVAYGVPARPKQS